MERTFQNTTAAKYAIAHIEQLRYKNAEVAQELVDFNKRPLSTRLDILYGIAEFQNRFVQESIKRNASVSLPSLGTFVVKQSSLVYRDTRNAIALDLRYADAPKIVREKIKKQAGEQQKYQLYKAAIKTSTDRKAKTSNAVVIRINFKELNNRL